MTKEVYIEKQGSIATLVLNRPEKKNALSRAMFLAIQEELNQLAEDKSVRVLIVRGVDETAFCSGADISEFLDIRFAKKNAEEYNAIALEAINTLYKFPLPTIALIQTLAIGGGLELANSCDFRFATPNSKFGITASNIGIIYNLESTKRLINVVGVSSAKEILYTAKLYNSVEAKEMGLLTNIFPAEEIEEKVQQFAEKLLTKSSVANVGIKKVIQEIVDGKIEESEEIAELILNSFSSKDYTEGITAFLEKRKPNFK